MSSTQQKIGSHLWFDKEAKEAAALYVSLFKNSRIKNISVLKDTPSGDCDVVTFEILGKEIMAIGAGPYFKLNPSISFFVTLDTEAEVETAWAALIQDGKALMEINTYPWAKKYGWLQDKYGMSWQLSTGQTGMPEMIAPMLMFTQGNAGKAKEAIEFYTSIFPDSKIDSLVPYEKGDGDTEGLIKHARFTLAGEQFLAMESTLKHDFVFNEAFSLMVNCETQEEIDFYWSKLSAVPESEQCGWCKDKFGVSWQITPKALAEFMGSGDQEKIKRVTQAFLQMKKFDLAALKAAAEGK